MSSFDKMLGWFPHTATEWIELVIVAVLLCHGVIGRYRPHLGRRERQGDRGFARP
jgi:hypothetical protein